MHPSEFTLFNVKPKSVFSYISHEVQMSKQTELFIMENQIPKWSIDFPEIIGLKCILPKNLILFDTILKGVNENIVLLRDLECSIQKETLT